jgi:hypothetical protein
MNFTDVKGGLSFFFRKVYASQEECGDKFDRDVLRTPFEDDFSADEMKCLMHWFAYYLIGFMKSYATFFTEPFARGQESCFIIYGYRNGDFFEDSHDDEESYLSAKEMIERNKIPFNLMSA